MVGIKGVGMAMLAQFLRKSGVTVGGSDVADFFPTDKTLFNAKIKVGQGFAISNIPDKIDVVIYSSAFNFNDNIELKYLKKRKLSFLSYAEALGALFNDYFGISVCGSHGKTTVSSWLGYVAMKSKLSPSVLTGSYVRQFRGSSVAGRSKYLIVESDEYQNKLQYLNPQGVVLNNIDFDHPDYFKNKKEYYQVFLDFIKKIPRSGFLVLNADDRLALEASKANKGENIYYSLDDSGNNIGKNYHVKNLQIGKKYQSFDLYDKNKKIDNFKIKLFGRHNVSNALAVISSGLELGIKKEDLKKSLFSFQGVARRFDVLGEYNGAVVIDDYAHHPREVSASLQAVKERYPDKRIVTFFHPHTFSRTKALMDDFAASFSESDDLYIIEIYSSAREKKDSISSVDLIEKIREHNIKINKKQKIVFLKDLTAAEKIVEKIATSNDVILLLGAGDIFRVGYNLLKL